MGVEIAFEAADDVPNNLDSSAPLLRAARLLKKPGTQKYADMEETLQISRQHIPSWLRAAAECARECENGTFRKILAYSEMLVATGQYTGHLLHKVKYDETMMHIRCCYSGGEMHNAYAKVFCFLESWSILLSSAVNDYEHFILRGGFMPKINVAQSATGETIAAIEDKMLSVPLAESTLPVWRLLETDECAANMRAEKIVSSQPDQGPKMHIVCAGHKTHQVASAVWEQFKWLHGGIVKTMVFLRSPGVFHRFVATFLRMIDEMLTVTSQPLSNEAIKHRAEVLHLFAPRIKDSARSNAVCKVVCEELLTGDWRNFDTLEHRCKGVACCETRAHTVRKFKHYIPMFLAALKLKRLNTDNWDAWQEALGLVGLLSMVHNCFSKVFLRTVEGESQHLERTGQAWWALDGEDQAANEVDVLEAGEVRKALRVAVKFWTQSRAWQELYLLRYALDVEIEIMHKLLSQTSAKAELQAAVCTPGSG